MGEGAPRSGPRLAQGADGGLRRGLQRPVLRRMQQGATRLQSMYRGKQGRKSVAKRRAERAELNGAATKVQTSFRGKQGRAKADQKKQAVIKQRKEEAAGATKLQSAFRGKQARKEVAQRRAGAP